MICAALFLNTSTQDRHPRKNKGPIWYPIYIIICLLEWVDPFMQPTSGKRRTERPRLWLDIVCHGPPLAGLCPACCGVCWCNLAPKTGRLDPWANLLEYILGCGLKGTSSCSRFLKLPGNFQHTLLLFGGEFWRSRASLNMVALRTSAILLHLERQQLMIENTPDCCLYILSVICCHFYIVAGCIPIYNVL